MNNDHITQAGIGRYVNGALTDIETRRVREHIDACSRCRDRLRAFQEAPSLADVLVTGPRESKATNHLDYDETAAYADGTCSRDLRARIRTHLDACAKCRSAVQDLRDFTQSMKQVASF